MNSDIAFRLCQLLAPHVRDGTEGHAAVREFLHDPTRPNAGDKLLKVLETTFRDTVPTDAALDACLALIVGCMGEA
jgi:hypothetical protein